MTNYLIFTFLQKNGNRAYFLGDTVGKREVVISKRVLENLKKWNTSAFRNSEKFDEKFIKLLFFACFGKFEAAKKDIPQECINFIQGFYILLIS